MSTSLCGLPKEYVYRLPIATIISLVPLALHVQEQMTFLAYPTASWHCSRRPKHLVTVAINPLFFSSISKGCDILLGIVQGRYFINKEVGKCLHILYFMFSAYHIVTTVCYFDLV